MTEKLLISFLAICFWTLDAIFTFLALRTRDKDAWKYELNYHKYFFKRFGLAKGSLISYCLSLVLIILVLYIADIKGAYMIMGIALGVSYYTYMTYLSYAKETKK